MTDDDAWVALLSNSRLGEYQLHEYRGGGNFGRVFAATHVPTGKKYAVKVLVPTSQLDVVAEFEREGELLAKLRKSSNVVDLTETGVETRSMTIDGKPPVAIPIDLRFHVMELASDCLEALVLNRGEVSWKDRFGLWRGVVLGIHQMHLKDIVHRDLKSGNCLLFLRIRNKVDSKVADLGRSRNLQDAPAFSPEDYVMGRGDLRFAPPEFLWMQGEDTRDGHTQADLYGLGSLLFEVVTGQAITSVALGPSDQVIRRALIERQARRIIDLSSLRKNYKLAFDMFADELPSPTRSHGLNLIKQLCDPDPRARFPRVSGRPQNPRNGLEWLLRKADILQRSLSSDADSRSRRYLRGAS